MKYQARETLGLMPGLLAIDDPSFVPKEERDLLQEIFPTTAGPFNCCGWLPKEGNRLVLQFGNERPISVPIVTDIKAGLIDAIKAHGAN